MQFFPQTNPDPGSKQTIIYSHMHEVLNINFKIYEDTQNVKHINTSTHTHVSR